MRASHTPFLKLLKFPIFHFYVSITCKLLCHVLWPGNTSDDMRHAMYMHCIVCQHDPMKLIITSYENVAKVPYPKFRHNKTVLLQRLYIWSQWSYMGLTYRTPPVLTHRTAEHSSNPRLSRLSAGRILVSMTETLTDSLCRSTTRGPSGYAPMSDW